MSRLLRFATLMSASCAAAGLLWSSPASAQGTVVYGNLGASGTGALSPTNTDYGGGTISDTLAKLAQGFSTGTNSQNLFVQSVSLGLFSNDSPAGRTVSIFTNNAGVPGTSLYTSASQSVTSTGVYTFNFTAAQLAASTTYWIVPSGPASWYLNANESQPDGLNASGWTYVGTKRETTASPGTWSTTIQPYSLSITAGNNDVPEIDPSGMASVIALVAGAFGIFERRRLKAA